MPRLSKETAAARARTAKTAHQVAHRHSLRKRAAPAPAAPPPAAPATARARAPTVQAQAVQQPFNERYSFRFRHPKPSAAQLEDFQRRQSNKMPPKRTADEAEVAPRASKRQSTAATKAAAAKPKAPAAKKAAAPAAKKTAAKKTAAPATKKAAPAPKKAAAAKKTPVAKAAAPKKVTAAAAKKAAAAAAKEAAPKAPKAPKVVKEKAAAEPKPHKFGPTINEAPKQRLIIWVFGEGSQGELGLGNLAINGREPTNVTRPRLNAFLDAEKVGVVKASCGGMHTAVITKDNKILTWGVNDQGALGRDSTDTRSEEEKDDEDDSGLNPMEATPMEVSMEHFPEGTVFTDITCSDSATFVVIQDGTVYGWGTFRAAEGILGFFQDSDPKNKIQRLPALIPELKKIVKITCGSNHVMATDIKKNVFAWGCGQQNQLGRRVVERTRAGGLVPREFGLPRGKIEFVNCGDNHSFAIDTKGQVWSWGLNNFGQTGIQHDVGQSNSVIPQPQIVTALAEYKIVQLAGGNHHSIALTEDGTVLAWGRSDAFALGVDVDSLPKEKVVFQDGKHRLVKEPVVIPGIKASFIASGTDNSFAVTTDGKVYSWGFSENSQTGQGPVGIVETATLIDNTAVRGKKITWAGAGGQFSMLAGPAEN